MKIHIVEDDRVFNRLIEHTLIAQAHYEVSTFVNAKDFIPHLADNPDVVTLDLGLPDMDGEDVLRHIKHYNADIEVIVISGQENISTAVQLLKQGAYDYITKDENITERLRNSLRNIEAKKTLKIEIKELKSEISNKYTYNNIIIGESTAIKNIFSLIDKAVKIPNINISIYGDTGTGKELVAKTIHYNSPRKNKPFIAVNMGAIPRDLIENELFGHEKGAFTGANTSMKGKFEEAEGGTLFLDEIGEMDFDLQVKLLRVIQEREITRIGGHAVIKVNTRIITASNKDLAEEVNKGHFREDLYYRLLGLPIHLPTLNERENDCLLLCNYFLESFCKENGMSKLELTPKAKKKLLNYNYPGNIRELKAIVELSAVLTNSKVIDEEHIVFNTAHSELELFSQELTLKEYTEKIIHHFLKKYHNNVLKVAEKLNIGKSTIYNMMSKQKQEV